MMWRFLSPVIRSGAALIGWSFYQPESLDACAAARSFCAGPDSGNWCDCAVPSVPLSPSPPLLCSPVLSPVSGQGQSANPRCPDYFGMKLIQRGVSRLLHRHRADGPVRPSMPSDARHRRRVDSDAVDSGCRETGMTLLRPAPCPRRRGEAIEPSSDPIGITPSLGGTTVPFNRPACDCRSCRQEPRAAPGRHVIRLCVRYPFHFHLFLAQNASCMRRIIVASESECCLKGKLSERWCREVSVSVGGGEKDSMDFSVFFASGYLHVYWVSVHTDKCWNYVTTFDPG